MFGFFDKVVEIGGIIVDMFVTLVETLVSFFGLIATGMNVAVSAGMFLPHSLQALFLFLISVSVIVNVLHKGG